MADDAPKIEPVPPPMIGSYRLVEPLGSGGMSSVFRALHAETGHEVAVKVLPRYLAKNPTLLQRFLREAKSAESLEDPNIVAIYDRGSEAGRYYLVLEYVPGGDLHDRVRDGGPMPVGEAVDSIRQVARGLRHAAGRGLIHRDIKPANILRTPEGRVKVTDLGLALHTSEEDERVTRDGTTVGTVDYMAPEQARDSRAASVKSDIYSLGCTFYYLLTGTPPFAGGDVPEKLKAHATEPPPDIRKTRPEAPEILARLIQKMMAKRPERRFVDYDQLLETLDAVAASLTATTGASQAAPLMALIDDEDDEPEHGPLLALIDEESDERTGPLLALIDDEDDDQGFALGSGPTRSPGSTAASPSLESWGETGTKRGNRTGSSPGDLNIADLAAIDEGTPSRPSVRKPPKSATTVPAGSRVEPVYTPPPEVAYDLEPAIASTPHLYELPPRSSPGLPIETWIVRVVLGAVLLLLLWFGWSQVVAPRLFNPAPGVGGGMAEEEGGSSPNNGGTIAEARRAKWREPADRVEPPPAEPPVKRDVLARLGMPRADREEAASDEGPFVTVRRLNARVDDLTLPDLPRAFDKLTGVVEIADDGPFFEDNFRIAGESRVLRAKPRDTTSTKSDYRPILVITKPTAASIQARPAVFVMNRQRLVVEGIDFVINGADLTPRQESMFLCKDADLTLRDCTITVVGPIKHEYAIVQVGERGVAANAPASTVRFERTRIRGEVAAVRLAGPAEVTFARSAVVVGRSPIVVAGEVKSERSVAIFRTVMASRGSMISLSGMAGSADALPMTVRAMESTFAAIGPGQASAPFVGMSEIPAGPARSRPLVTWRGEANRFDGWGGWSSASPQGVLATIQAKMPDAERLSNETSSPWPEAAADRWSTPAVPATVATRLASPTVLVAKPAPLLKEKTLGRFDRLAIGGPDTGGKVLALKFNAEDPSWNGDIGRFLAELPKRGVKRVRVDVTGTGRHDASPILMPPGVSLEIAVTPASPGAPPLIWTTPEGSNGEAMFGVQAAELALTGVRLTATPKSLLRFLASADHGNLFLSRCILTGPGEVENESAVGGLVVFKTDGTRPFPDASGAARPVVDRPSCVLTDSVFITGGDAITADVGRGVVALTNCAIAAEASALVLRPQSVRRDRFEADLVLDRCTIAAEKNVVMLGPWTGLDPGPDRPWVIWSSSCMFTDSYQRTGGFSRGVALRSAVDGMARGALAWQSARDTYDLTQFTAAADLTAPSGRADLRRSWVELWGPSHIVSPSGPTSSGGEPNARLLVDRLKPGEIAPGDLALDPTYPRGRTSLDVGADLGRMGIAPTVTKFRPAGK
ncbi:MAG: serine/threonine protein kinase [Planctomycetota bacterium]|nr:serine/threonine protein kinase [Planctomycetota bacterium]